jgi:tetratricopeptide (TPR) repeat protein
LENVYIWIKENKIMPIIEAFVTAVALASNFGAGRDGKKVVDLVEFQTWLIESGNQEIADAIEKSQATSIYIKALLNQQLPLIIESINEISQKASGIPISLEALLNTQADVLLKAVNNLERKITDLAQTSSVNQRSTGDRSPNIVQQGNGNFHLNLGDTIATQVNNHNYGVSLEAHETALKKREQEVVERLSTTEPSDRLVREVLEKELNGVIEKLNNLNQSYEEELATRKAVENTIKKIKDELPDLQSDAALEKLQEGDTEAAKLLFDKVIEKADQTNELAGKAASENGRMAKNEIRYWEARGYFEKAVRFQPENSEYNFALGLILETMTAYVFAKTIIWNQA